MVVHVLDDYYLTITLLVTIVYQLSGFAIAWTLQIDKITDFTGGSNFFILALLTLLLGGTFHTRNIVASVLVMIWAARLAGFLLYRVLYFGRDGRFDELRSKFFWFLGFWVSQITWVWLVSLPVIVLNSPGVSEDVIDPPAFGTSSDIAGVIIWAIGWLTETIGDAEKFRWKASKPSRRGEFMQTGLWSWSRHPPYFGEILCWWGIWILCLSQTAGPTISGHSMGAQYGTIVSPVFTCLILLFFTGAPTAEKPTARRMYLAAHGSNDGSEHAKAWDTYKRYLEQTSFLIPIPPFIYRPLPRFIKRTILLDFPIYQFDEKVDGKKALERAKGKATSQEVAATSSRES